MNIGLLARLTLGEWRAHPLRALVSVLAIAIGVALGFAVHLINQSALDEFANGMHVVNGQADLQIRATSTSGFDEQLYGKLNHEPDIMVSSPIIEVDAALAHQPGSLRILGLDVMRAALITPSLLGQPAHQETLSDPAAMFDPDAIYLSADALAFTNKHPGDKLDLLIGNRIIPLVIAGTLPGIPAGQRLAVMDIAGAQWRLDKLGKLTRIDLKMAQGANIDALRRHLAEILPPDAQLSTGADEEARTDSLSRAYRVNLDMLALMALFTGAFLVYSTQSLSVARRRGQLALLRIMGVTTRGILLQVLCEGTLLGLVGGVLGLIIGYGFAAAVFSLLGGDLGGGYFQGVHTQPGFAPQAAISFFLLGITAALLGSLIPARSAAQGEPAATLKSAGEAIDPRRAPPFLLPLILLSAGTISAFLPPWRGLPVSGYIGMSLLLFGGIAAMPWLARTLLNRWASPAHTSEHFSLAFDLALKRLWGAPSQAAVALCGIVASASLMVAMIVMIASFRQSVDQWLGDILSADLFIRVAGSADSAGFDNDTQTILAALPGISNIRFQKMIPVKLAANLPAVMLTVRAIDITTPQALLPMVTGRYPNIPPSAMPIWVSEAMVDLYHWAPGQTVYLPLQNGVPTVPTGFFVAGIWRDYARQYGTIVIRDSDYTRLTGDHLRTDAAIKLSMPAERVIQSIRKALPQTLAARLEFAQVGEIRAITLRIFDRSFAVTYLLEAVAVLIGLTGVATTFSAQTLARAREFGMLRHIGVVKREIMLMLAYEGALLGAIGSGAGVALGLVMSQILIHVINPQSFHWTMDTHIPWLALIAIAVALLLASSGAALVAGRRALSIDVVRSVRVDW